MHALSGLGARIANHGANAGDDAFRTVDAMAVIGAPSAPPPPSRLSPLHAPARPCRSKAVETTAPVLMTNGTGVMVPVLAYSHPAAQAVHASIHQAALDQGAARPRQILRTAASPLALSIFGNAAPGVPVDSVVRWAEVRPDRLMMMVADRRVHSNAADMAELHPALFTSEKAASSARGRFGSDWVQRLHGYVVRDRQPWSRVRWQPTGQGQQLRTSWCPAAELAAMRAEIEAQRGELVHWQAERWTSGRRPREDIPAPDLALYGAAGMSSPTSVRMPLPAMADSFDARVLPPPDG